MKRAVLAILPMLVLAGCATSSGKGTVTQYAHQVSALQIVYLKRPPFPVTVKSYTPSIDMNDMEQRALKVSDAFEKKVGEILPVLAQQDGVFEKLSFGDASKRTQRDIEENLDKIGYTASNVLVMYPASAELWCQTNLLFQTSCSAHLKVVTILYDAQARREMWRSSHSVLTASDARYAVHSVWKTTMEQLRSNGLVVPSSRVDQ